MNVFAWCVVRPAGRLGHCQTDETGMEKGRVLFVYSKKPSPRTCSLGPVADPYPEMCASLGLRPRIPFHVSLVFNWIHIICDRDLGGVVSPLWPLPHGANVRGTLH